MTDTITQIGHGLKSGRHRDDVPCSLNSGARGSNDPVEDWNQACWSCFNKDNHMIVLDKSR